MTAKDILTLAIATVGAGIALATLIKACVEYVRQGRVARAQMFFDLRRRLKEPSLAELAEWIDEAECGDPAGEQAARDQLVHAPLRTKRDYLGLFEEVDIMVSSGLVKPEIASYMFGYYALRCAACDPFWQGVNRLSPYWNRFFDFCRKMAIEEAALAEAQQPLPPTLAPAGAARRLRPSGGPCHAVTIKLAPVLRASAAGRTELRVFASTVGEALAQLAAHHPEACSHVLDASRMETDGIGALKLYVNVYCDNEDVRSKQGLDTAVKAGSVIRLLPNASGG